MKIPAISEPKVLLEVRRIKEQIAREAENAPGYYLRLNDTGEKLLAPFRRKRTKSPRP